MWVPLISSEENIEAISQSVVPVVTVTNPALDPAR